MFPKPKILKRTEMERATHRIKEIDETLQRYGDDIRVIKPDRKKNLIAERDDLLQKIKTGEIK
jgi:hypothetical protein